MVAVDAFEVVIALVLLGTVAALTVACMKGNWVPFAVGLLVFPVAYVGALLPARPGSYWAKHSRPTLAPLMALSSRRSVRPLWPLLGWTACGLGFALALLTPSTIGLPAAAASVALTLALLACERARGSATAGLIAGCGLLALAIAYLNRDGPGDVCTTSVRESSCTGEWSPWPWLGVGVVFRGAAVTLVLRSARDDRRS